MNDNLVNDCISSQAALDALCNIDEYNAKSVSAIKALPPAQPEIIRCKDCKYNSNPPEYGNAVCDCFYGMTDQMGFCHYGERREQE